MCFNQDIAISTLIGKPLKLVDPFVYLGSNISSTDHNVKAHIGQVWTVNEKLTTIWTSDLSDKIKWEFLQAVAVSVLLYGCTSPSAQEGCDTRSVFKQILIGFNSSFPSSWLVISPRLKNPICPTIYPWLEGE